MEMEERQQSTATYKTGNEVHYVMCTVYCEHYSRQREFRERLGTVRVILYSALQDLNSLNM
jgi:hypothetical protein